jgi:hypothetical protein
MGLARLHSFNDEDQTAIARKTLLSKALSEKKTDRRAEFMPFGHLR